jgi:hypothetical protein
MISSFKRIFIYLFISLIISFIFFLHIKHPLNYIPKIEKLDNKVINFINSFGIEKEALIRIVKHSYQVKNKKLKYIRRDFWINDDFPIKQFQVLFKNEIKKAGFKIKLSKGNNYYQQDLYLKSYPVYSLIFEFKPKIAIVIDDWGYNLDGVDFLENINIPLNIAILPNLNYTEKIDRIAWENGHEVLLHLPLEPELKEEAHKHMEKITILSSMKKEEIESILDKFISQLKEIKGVNNHMGSLISKNEKIMRIILKKLKKKNLYYLDSLVVKRPVSEEIAGEIKLKYFKRDVFLDNIIEEKAVMKQLNLAEKIAKNKGYVIAICHAKKKTFKILRDLLPQLKSKFQFVKLSEIKVLK